MYTVFDLLSICTHRLNEAGDVALIDDTLNRAPALWQAVWEHRDVLDLQLLEERGISTEDDLLEIASVSVLFLHHHMHVTKWGSVLVTDGL